MGDKYTALWVSYSSISDFLKCPKAYYLKNVYKDKKSGNKIQLVSPPLALGQAVHEVIESLSEMSVDRRFEKPLHERFEKAWEKISGKRGGFFSDEIEKKYKQRGIEMLERVKKNPGPLKKLTVKINMELPQYFISEEDNIILCGKVDWLEYFPDSDKVHIIDFKTSQEAKEDPDSLQLPIYLLLVKNCQKREVSKVSYWYIEQNDEPVEKELPDEKEATEKVLKIAKKIKLARQLESFNCPNGDEGCRECNPMQDIVDGKAEYIYTDSIRRDIYVLDREKDKEDREGTIL